MQEKELLELWQSYDQKLERVLSLNQEMVYEMTKNKLNATLSTLRLPKRIMLLIGIPYTLLLYFITFIAYQAAAVFVTFGFGAIALIMSTIVISYCYHLVLIHQISHSKEIIEVQKKLAELKLSSFHTARWAMLQLPFWSICWMSWNTLKDSPLIYGGINLSIFLGLAYLAYWLYRQLDMEHQNSWVSRLLLSGREWEPIIKSSEILEQLKSYE
ncbi:MAG: hypothetical protein AAF806_06825 [Bacteroidota bacterium]